MELLAGSASLCGNGDGLKPREKRLSNADPSQTGQGTLKGTDTLATTNAEDVDKANHDVRR